MNLKKTFKSIAPALINPVAAIGTIASAGEAVAGYIGAEKDREAAARANADNAALQREFAQNSIRWKVEDAKAAGLHPLAALGAQGYSASPSYVSEPVGEKYRALGSMGQNISRAINATITPEEKAYRALQVESLAIDNALKKKELEDIQSPGLPSNSSLGRHLLGQNPLNYGGGTGYVSEMPTSKSHASPGRPHQAAGEYTDFVFARTPTGLHPVPSKEMQEAIEDKLIPETLWAARNYIYPIFSPSVRRMSKPSLREHPLPPGYDWEWKPVAAEWRPYKQSGRSLWQKFLD